MKIVLNNLMEEAYINRAEALAKSIDEQILWSIQMSTKTDWQYVAIPFVKHSDDGYFWNEACAWAIEEFGLPGDRYVTYIGDRAIEFLFKNEKDAILMTLKWM